MGRIVNHQWKPINNYMNKRYFIKYMHRILLYSHFAISFCSVFVRCLDSTSWSGFGLYLYINNFSSIWKVFAIYHSHHVNLDVKLQIHGFKFQGNHKKISRQLFNKKHFVTLRTKAFHFTFSKWSGYFTLKLNADDCHLSLQIYH